MQNTPISRVYVDYRRRCVSRAIVCHHAKLTDKVPIIYDFPVLRDKLVSLKASFDSLSSILPRGTAVINK